MTVKEFKMTQILHNQFWLLLLWYREWCNLAVDVLLMIFIISQQSPSHHRLIARLSASRRVRTGRRVSMRAARATPAARRSGRMATRLSSPPTRPGRSWRTGMLWHCSAALQVGVGTTLPHYRWVLALLYCITSGCWHYFAAIQMGIDATVPHYWWVLALQCHITGECHKVILKCYTLTWLRLEKLVVVILKLQHCNLNGWHTQISVII